MEEVEEETLLEQIAPGAFKTIKGYKVLGHVR